MITRRKAALMQTLPQSVTQWETATSGNSKTETARGVDTPGGRDPAKKMHVISLSSDSEENDDDRQEDDSESDYSDEKEASAMSLSSDMSVMNLSSDDDECTTEKDDESEVVQASSAFSIDDLMAEKVLQIIKDGGDLKKLTLDNCRSYLRHNGMRISGNKPVLIDRIKQHIELKQGVLEKYRAASFTVNCTGDVCRGDVIKFKQKVYRSLNIAKKGAKAVGERIVVGRVVKESYGEIKQQHTFTVEVLWSAGYKPLPPMRQLLVKGRNLYKLRTYRQKWENEELRKTSLDEKHERGAAARAKRRETLRASGPRKIAVGSRNPYVAMGISRNSQPDFLGGRGCAGRVGALQRSCFPKYPLVHEQPNMLPHKPMGPQSFGYDASRVDANHHINPPAGVAHDTRNQCSNPMGGAFHTQAQQARTNHYISGLPRDTGASPLRLQGRLDPLPDPPLDRRQNGSRSPWRYDSNSWRRDVEQRNSRPDRSPLPTLVHPSTNQHFNCSNFGCLNFGSKFCSYRVCARCCKKQGRLCSNPKH